ncbi:hypothetical protein MSPP1_002170 [Malassezia sp. CBS 17886]|nr:hypothetical protein MSPP1_002170 [Malassezia sp. CBS 17886]
MYEDWFTQVGGPDVWDEWTMSQKLGDRMVDVLNQHMSSWFIESDMDTIHRAGVNMIRVPIGYWAFVQNAPGEPYKNTTQLDRLSDVLTWAHQRKTYVLVDMHGLPGSQNGDQSSGRNTSLQTNGPIPWYSTANQQLSLQTLDAMLAWIDRHPSRSVVSGVTSVNEPQTFSNASHLDALKKFYTNSLHACKKYKMPLIAHHGFVDNPYEYWHDFFDDNDPAMLVFDDHPYPGWFPPREDKDAISDVVCGLGKSAHGFPSPVLMGEYSAVTNINTTAYTTSFMASQLGTYGWSAGSMFFNFKVNSTEHPVLAEAPVIMDKYSMFAMQKQGSFPSRPQSNAPSNFTDALPNPCGSDPKESWS